MLVLCLGKAVILALRPPIELPRTAIPVPVLEELIRDLSTLASVYHKPAETFIGSGRVGAGGARGLSADLEDDVERALQTVTAGRKAENLLDFDDPASGTGTTNSLTNLNLTTSPAAILTSSNPLADSADIFSGDSMNLSNTSSVMSPNITGSPSVSGSSIISPVSGGGGGEDLVHWER
ncbi:beta-adaptin [Ceratobasidium sp. 392]|nr:beta-adaptin [Ceratobasidium sp. 392]